MENTTLFSTMDAGQMRQVNGGGFAYDVGRVLRFISIAGLNNGPLTALALADWDVNKALNEMENN